MGKYKAHMIFFADDDGDFTTMCGITSGNCSESFMDDAKLVAYFNKTEATCKRCLSEFEKQEKYIQEEEDKFLAIQNKVENIRKNSEIFDQPHQMYAEGMYTEEIDEVDVSIFLIQWGYNMDGYRSWYDDIQKCWRWTSSIKPMGSPLDVFKTTE